MISFFVIFLFFFLVGGIVIISFHICCVATGVCPPDDPQVFRSGVLGTCGSIGPCLFSKSSRRDDGACQAETNGRCPPSKGSLFFASPHSPLFRASHKELVVSMAN